MTTAVTNPLAAPVTRPAAAAACPWRFCVAPMMDWTDRHCRYFHRQLAPSARLYTEMVTTGAVLHGDRERLLGFDPAEHPVAVQLGGSDPEALACAARICEDLGYDEVNLNVGCPSDRVRNGRFGACLMREPERVAECVAAMVASVDVPVTVKHRLGVDEQDTGETLTRFVATVRAAGCRVFLVHARKAWLGGLSPRENRDLPPLDHRRVHRLKEAFPELTIVLNGGLDGGEETLRQLDAVDGVMLGRAAYQRPLVLAALEAALGGAPERVPATYVRALVPYLERHLAAGGALKHVTRHLLGLFHGAPGARGWRRVLGESSRAEGAGLEVLCAALAAVGEDLGAPRPPEPGARCAPDSGARRAGPGSPAATRSRAPARSQQGFESCVGPFYAPDS